MIMNVLNCAFETDLILITKFPVKARDIQKNEKQNSIETSVFCFENKEKHPIYGS